MKIFLNSKEYEADENSSLQSLLQKVNMTDSRGIAIAVNEVVIPKNDWEKYFLKDNDSILVIKATQGG